MKYFLLPIIFSALVASHTFAGTVFKCSSESGVTYQSLPCVEGTSEVIWSSKQERQSGVSTAAPIGLKDQPDGQPTVSILGELQAGISDLQVLNNRLWGKPQRISRNREPRAWHEYWYYKTGANRGKQLHFVNSRLAGIKELEAPSEVIDTPAGMVVVERNSLRD